MCQRGLFAQCETTQNTRTGKGASLFGYTSLYGSVPGGQAECVRVPHADFGPVVIPQDLPDERYLYLSDILPTAWQAVEYADVNGNDTLAVLGLGPVGQLAVRSALHRGVGRVIGVDLVPDRLEKAAAPRGRGHRREQHRRRRRRSSTSPTAEDPTPSIDAVGMEAHGNPRSEKVIGAAGRLPKPVARQADRAFRHRPARGAAHRGRRRSPRWHPLDQRRLRRRWPTRCR